ncbi:MAG: hypothetical protein ABEI07_01700 [Candidatus Nanohaloarchaea archaeon]
MDVDRMRERFDRVDRRIAAFLSEEGLVVLRYSLALVFIWFGALKLVGGSPAAELVADTVYWFRPEIFVPVLGVWEVCIGLCFLYRPLIRVAIALLAPQMLGTFLPFLILPGVTFQQFPFVLTMEGQYILKNLVIIGAAMVVGGTVR